MSKVPVFSFVVPVYKTDPDVFEKCLEKLFDQSLKDIEVIAVFDGPDEDLQALVKNFPKVKSLVVEHGGAPKARNAGLDAATGKYVWFWDADCFAKPEMAKRRLEEFEATGADFIYSGYEVAGEQGGFESEAFDTYSLSSGNYICTMTPVLREKAPRWDESLTAGQDWDYWLTATEKGLKGAFLEGSAFVTMPQNKDSISAKGLSSKNRHSIIAQIQAKHGIETRETGVFTTHYRNRGLKVAEILGADFIKATGYDPTHYKTILNLGYNYLGRWDGIASDVTKIQYWMPIHIEALKQSKYATVMETIRIAKDVTNLCGTTYEKNALNELGIQAEVATLPLADDELNDLETDLPGDFSILVVTDEHYGKLIQEIQQDLPHIKFGYQKGNVKEYSCLLSFYGFAALDETILHAQVNGRNVISNVQAPFCGFVDPQQSWEGFKKDLYEQIRLMRGKAFNKEARDYYKQLVDPEKFRAKVRSLSAPKLEVLSA